VYGIQYVVHILKLLALQYIVILELSFKKCIDIMRE